MPERAPNTRRRVCVLHIASGDLWAGAEAQILQQTTRLATLPELTVQVALLNEGELARRLRANGIRVHIFDEAALSILQILASLSRLVRREAVDLIHTHRAKENFIGGVLSFLHGKRSLRTVHGAQEHPPRSIFNRRYLGAALDGFAGRYLQQAIVAVSAVLAQILRQEFGDLRVVYIPNGIDVHAVRNAARGNEVAEQSVLRVGIVGRLVAVKRIDVFLLAAKELASRHPGKFRFLIVGDGPVRAELEKCAEEWGLASDCEFLGFRTDSLQLIAGLHALVVTSDHEGQPMVVLEALAAGVPVVAHCVGGLTELIGSDRQGILVERQDARLFADAIEKVTSAASAVSGSRLEERFDISHTVQQYHSLYRKLLGLSQAA